MSTPPSGSLQKSPVVVRDFRPADQAAVRRLVLDGLAEHWGTVDETLNPELDDIATAYGAGRTLVAEREVDGTLVATGTILPRPDDHVDSTAEIVRMSVAAPARRTGLGRRVLDELLATARSWSATRVVLETHSSWTDAVGFYLASGFVVTGTVDGDFGPETWFERRL